MNKILSLSRVIIFGVWFLLFFKLEYLHWSTIFIAIGLDMLVRLYTYFQIKQKQKKKEWVFVKHQRFKPSFVLKLLKVFILIIIVLITIYCYVSFKETIIGIVIPNYILASSLFFFNDFDGYLIDHTGIKQFGWLEKSYLWSEIEQIVIHSNKISWKIGAKSFLTKINERNAKEIEVFLKEIARDYTIHD